MNNTSRLSFVKDMTSSNLDELWQNCFAGAANQQHMNAYVPHKVTSLTQLRPFLMNNLGSYSTWLIKRVEENDIIGFAIHGNYIPEMPNNIGFNIGLEYIRNGYATETIQELIEFLRRKGLTETFGHCFEANTPSVSLMEGIGFQNLGRTTNRPNGHYELKFRYEL